MPNIRKQYWVFSGTPAGLTTPTPRGIKGTFKRRRKTINNLQWFGNKLAPDCRRIRIHTFSISTNSINLLINYLQYRFPSADIRVRLLPDGTANLVRHPMKLSDYLRQWKRKLYLLYARELNCYCYSGDLTGAEADIVDRIYWFDNIPHEYPSEKIYRLRFNVPERKVERHQDQALVLGNPAWESLRQGMLEWTLKAIAGKEVLYKPHPSETEPPLPNYCRIIKFDESLEDHLMENHYPLIIGIVSTGLWTARLICGSNVRIVCYGINRMRKTISCRKEIAALNASERIYRKFSIESVDA